MNNVAFWSGQSHRCVVSGAQYDLYLTHRLIWGSAVGGSGAASAVCRTSSSTTGWQLNFDLYDIFSFTAEGKSQLLSRWWSPEPHAVEKHHLTLTEKTQKAIALFFTKNGVFVHPSLTLVCTVKRQLKPPWPSLLASGKMYGARSVSLFSHYTYLPINIILSLPFHWPITCWVLLHTPGRQFSFQTWCLLLQDDWQWVPGRDGVTPGKPGVSCLTTRTLIWGL